MAVRLRYLAHDLEVPVGQFLIGRTPDCQLSLDDPLVSRRHALLTVRAEGVFIEDLDSRNGVFVNGQRLDKITQIHDGDQIRIGSQELSLYGLGDKPANAARSAREPQTSTVQDLRVLDILAEDGDPFTLGGGSSPSAVPSSLKSPPSGASAPDKRVHGLSLIGGVADKALAMGRVDEAERILQRPLQDVLVKAQKGEVALEFAEKAAGYAMRLASATGRGQWVDYIFSLYTVLRALLPARIVDELYSVVRKVKHIDRAVLRTYTARLREISNGFGPAERFIQQRIESFERWAP